MKLSTKLYDSTSNLVYDLILRILPNPDIAEDVLLDVYLHIWRKGDAYNANKGPALAWLFMIARSRAIDALRSRAVREFERQDSLETAGNVADSAPSPEENSEIGQRRRFVQRCLADLPNDQREAIELAFFSGLSHSEIAETLKEPQGEIKTRVRLAMARLRESLCRYQEQP